MDVESPDASDASMGQDASGPCGPLPSPDLRLIESPGSVALPRLIWDGTRYGAIWYDNRAGRGYDVYFAFADVHGVLDATSIVRVSPEDGAGDQFARGAFSGTEFGIVYSDDRMGIPQRHVYFARVDHLGAFVPNSELLLNGTAGMEDYPAIAWDPADATWGVAWNDLRSTSVEFERIDAQGALVANSRITVAAGALGESGNDPLIWANTRWAIVYSTTHGPPAIAEISAAGMVETSTTIGASGLASLRPTFALGGGQYGIVWMERPSLFNVVHFGLATTGGRYVSGSDHAITMPNIESGEPTIAFDGTSFTTAWTQQTTQSNADLYTARFGGDGMMSRGPTAAATSTASEGWPEISWNGCQLSLVYQLDSAGHPAQAHLQLFR
jgi:hypothetical protein